MTRRSHIPSPTAEEVQALLQAAKWTAYEVAPLIGVSEQSICQAAAGKVSMRGTAWKLLQILASEDVRISLPPARIGRGRLAEAARLNPAYPTRGAIVHGGTGLFQENLLTGCWDYQEIGASEWVATDVPNNRRPERPLKEKARG